MNLLKDFENFCLKQHIQFNVINFSRLTLENTILIINNKIIKEPTVTLIKENLYHYLQIFGKNKNIEFFYQSEYFKEIEVYKKIQLI